MAASPVAAAGAASGAQPGMWRALHGVAQREGLPSLWKGNGATILHRLPYSSINFFTYERAAAWLKPRLPPELEFGRQLAAGGLAGLVACSAAYPLDLVRTRLAAQTAGAYYQGVGGSLARIVADEGFVGLYRGLGATLLQVVPSLALNFSLYQTVRGWYTAALAASADEARAAALVAAMQRAQRGASAVARSSDDAAGGAESGSAPGALSTWQWWRTLGQQPEPCSPSSSSSSSSSSGSSGGLGSQGRAGGGHSAAASTPPGLSLAAGCIAGFVTSTATFPLDVVRRRMQLHGRQHPGGASSYGQVIRTILGAQGLRGFYAGILPEYCKVVPGVAIAFATYEALKEALGADGAGASAGSGG